MCVCVCVCVCVFKQVLLKTMENVYYFLFYFSRLLVIFLVSDLDDKGIVPYLLPKPLIWVSDIFWCRDSIIPLIFMFSSRFSASTNVICHTIRCFRNIFVVFSICAAGSYILKSAYLGCKLLLKQLLLKTMEHCLFIIFNFIFSRLLIIFLVSGSRWKRNKVFHRL